MNRWTAPLLIFVAGGVYYVLQACPTFYFWDSAELTAAVLTGGIPHPPGFPFFMILARLWTGLLPFDPAYGLNLFSAFFAALGLALWNVVVRGVVRGTELSKHDAISMAISITAVLVMAVSLTYSIQATRLEVYSLNFCGFGAMILVAMALGEGRVRPGPWSIIFFILMGLSLGIHSLTIALAIPGILMLLLMTRTLRLREAALGLSGAVLAALFFYLSILYLARKSPELNWGNPSDLRTLIDYILVKGFSVSPIRLTAAHIADNLGFVFGVLSKQLGIAGLTLSFAGMVYLLLKRATIGVPLTVILALNGLSVVFAENYFYENYDLHGYLTISLAILVLGLAVSLALLFNVVLKRLNKEMSKSAFGWSAAVTAVVATLALAVPVKENLSSADLSRVYTAKTYAQEFIGDAPDDAIVITSSYNTYFCVLAYRAAYGKNRGLAILNLYNWDHTWGQEQVNSELRCSLPVNVKRQAFYRGLINQFLKNRKLYVEYNESSGPIAQYLRPQGLGYLFSVGDSSQTDPQDIAVDVTSRVQQALISQDIESIRTWVLWFQNRGEYYRRRGDQQAAQQYFAAVDSLAARTQIEQ